MADQWYYRMFGQDFGPVSFDELKQLAELGSISASDEVRQSNISTWSTADSVTELGLSTGSGPKPIVAAIAEVPVQSAPSGANDWYYKFHGQELGPIGFDEIVAFAEQGQLEASDEVRLGTTGKWRRVGSIGRLVAVLPYHEPVIPQPVPIKRKSEAQIPAVTPPVTAKAATAPSPSKPVVNVPDEALIQAQATYAATDQAARALVSWALAPNVDPSWWAWVGGVERGPIGFVQVYELAMSGQLQASDYVKNGMYGQYVHAANVPSLFNAVSLVVQAKQVLEVAKATAAANVAKVAKSNPVVTAASAPVASVPATPTRSAANLPAATTSAALPVKKSSVDVPVAPEPVVPPKPPEPVRPVEVRVPEPQPAPVVSRPASSSSFASPPPRPATPSRPSVAARRDSGPSAFDAIKDPKVLGGLGAVVALVALFFGWEYLPLGSGKDVEIYKQAQALLTDIRAARAAKTTDFSSFKTRAEELKSKYVPDLKNEASNAKPVKQALLFALRDEIPRTVNGNMAVESSNEKSAIAHLQEAAKRLGVK